MADYTVRVVGANSGGGSSPTPTPPGGNAAPTPPTPTTGNKSEFVPDSRTIVDDFRRLVQAQGGVIVPGSSQMSQLYRQFGDQQKDNVRQQVTDKYDARRAAISEKYGKERDYQLDSFEEQRQALLAKGKGRNSKEWKQLEKEEDEEFKLIDKREKVETSEANKEEKDELASALRELTNVLKDSKEAAERDDERGDGTDSYLGRLRADRQKILEERDNAATEEETKAASKRLAEKDEEIRKATSGGKGEEGKPVFDRLLAGTKGVQQMFDAAENGDMASGIMGAGSTISGFGGLSLGASMGVMGVAAVAAGVAKAVQGSAERYDAMGTLAAYRPGNTENNSNGVLAATVDAVENGDFHGMGYSALGMKHKEFSERAARTIGARGTSNDWWDETYRQIGLEKNLALGSGTLESGSRFDRYGETVTRGLSDLVTALSSMHVEGAQEGDFSRVKEKYDFQQGIMQSYLGRADKPNYDVANRAVIGMNYVSGITHDQRDMSDYQIMQNSIQNPKNDRVRAMIFSTVAEMMPELVNTDGTKFTAQDAGRMDLIDRAIKNPENEAKIMQAMMSKMNMMYGGTDTQLGYFAWQNMFKGITADRLDQYSEQFGDQHSRAARVFRGEKKMDEWLTHGKENGAHNMEAWTQQAQQLQSAVSENMTELSNMVSSLVDVLTTWLNSQ